VEQMQATEYPDIPVVVAWMDVAALVVNNPGCTVGELVRKASDEDTAALVLQTFRLKMLPELHRAAASGHLYAGPQRACKVRNHTTTTWMPVDSLAPQARPVSGLRRLETLALQCLLSDEATR
jgi:hypothetical protein